MSKLDKRPPAPKKIKYKLFVAYCVMSILPILAGVAVLSFLIQFPLEANPANLFTVALVILISLALSVLGYQVTKQLTEPIAGVAAQAKKIAHGELEEDPEIQGSSAELEELSVSLKTISSNARELLEKVEKLSMKDTLTGLYNATYIRERLGEEIQRAVHYQQTCSFGCFVVDGFEEFRKRYGAPASEEALKAIAASLSECLSKFDRAAHIALDEFAVIFPDRNKKETIAFTERIRKAVAEKPILVHEGQTAVHLTVSAGISENPIDGASAAELYSKARERSKIAKRKGANSAEALA